MVGSGRAHPIALLSGVRGTDPENASRSEARRDGSCYYAATFFATRGAGAPCNSPWVLRSSSSSGQ